MMSEVIKSELLFFGISLSTGILILFGYDLLRAFRRVFLHSNFWLAVEDFLYWSIAGIVSFGVIFVKNSGALRGFSLAAILLGMALYHKSVSRYILKGVSWVLQLVTGAVRWILHILLFPFFFLSKKMRKIAQKTLKNRIKEVKMTICKK
jgi:spore cortex biosynthesis protein YabQ